MRWLIFAIMLCTVACIQRLPRGSAPPITRPLYLFDNYHSPLPADLNGSPFLRLCGNGVLNKASDYNDPADSIRVDEECDDGNRLDGDGCSADCMDVDTLVSPCKVNTVPLAALAIDPVTSVVYVATKTGTVETMQFTATGVVTTPVATAAVESMAVYNGSVFIYANKQLSWSGQTTAADNGLWIHLARQPIFITFSQTEMKLINCVKGTTLTLSASVNLTQCYTSSDAPITCKAPTGTYYIDTNTEADGTYSLRYGAIRFSPYSPPPATDDVPAMAWVKAFLEYMTKNMVQTMVPMRAIVADSRVKRNREIIVSANLFGVTKSNLRALKSPTTQDAFQTQEIQALGNTLLVRAIKTLDLACYEGDPCYLDATDPLFTQQSQVLQHPRTNAFFILDGNTLYYIGRRGTQVRTGEGFCLPYEIKACPAGQWADIDGACGPCPASVGGGSPLAQQIQCRAQGAARRRLLAAQTVTVQANIKAGDEVLRAAFPGATVQNGRVYIETTDPRAELQRMHAAIQSNSWEVLRNPEVLYGSNPNPPPAKDEGLNLVTIVVPAVLGFLLVAGLVVLFGWFWWPCHDYKEVSK